MSHEGYAVPVPQRILPDPRYLVIPQLGAEHAQPRIRAEMCDGTLRPPDAAEASRVEVLHALFVPFWRVEIARPDHVARAADERRGYLGVPVSHDSPSDGRSAWMVCARFRFPYEMKHPTIPIPSDSKPLVLPLRVLQQGDPDPSWGWEEVQADIDHAAAVELAMTSYRKFAVEPDALFSGIEPAIQAVHFVRYPIWLARYRYRNDRAPSADGMFHVGISALDGTAIMALHPSKLAAGAAKLKKMFGL